VFTVGNVLATTFRIWLRNLPRLVLIAVICYLPVFAFYMLRYIDAFADVTQRYYYDPIWKLHPALQIVTGGEWIAYAMTYGAIASVVVARIRGERLGIFRGLGRALRRSPSLIGVEFLVHLATTGVITLATMCIWSRDEWMWRGTGIYGWILWGASAVVLSSLIYVVAPVAVIERKRPLSTIVRNFALTRGDRFKVLAIVLVLWVIAAAASYSMLRLFLHYVFAGDRFYIELYGYARLGFDLLFATLAATNIAVTYEQLREAKEGPTPEALDRVFG
jgi:heme exporter protein D